VKFIIIYQEFHGVVILIQDDFILPVEKLQSRESSKRRYTATACRRIAIAPRKSATL